MESENEKTENEADVENQKKGIITSKCKKISDIPIIENEREVSPREFLLPWQK